MTGAAYPSKEIEKLGENVQEDASSPLAGLIQRAEESRNPDGTFTALQPGDLSTGMTNGIIARLKRQAAGVPNGYGDMSPDLGHDCAGILGVVR